MVSRKASAPKRAAATQKLSKKAATATEKATAKAKKSKAAAKTKTNAAVVVNASTSTRADASALATTSGSAAAAADKHSDRGKVLYVGHLPHGFYEEQLRGYFSQFGAVTRVRLSRVKKTGKPRSYAFMEFANPAVAEIAADAMDGYLMFSQRLSVKVLAPEAVHPTLFKGANRTFAKVPWRQLEAKRVNKKLTAEEAARRRRRAAKADAKRAERIEKSGINYQYERLMLENALTGKDAEGEDGPKEEDETKKKSKEATVAAAASKGKKAKAAVEGEAEAVAGQQQLQQQPVKKKAKTATSAAASAAAAAPAPEAAKKKPAAKKAAAAPAAAVKKTKRDPVAAAAATATRSSKRARG